MARIDFYYSMVRDSFHILYLIWHNLIESLFYICAIILIIITTPFNLLWRMYLYYRENYKCIIVTKYSMLRHICSFLQNYFIETKFQSRKLSYLGTKCRNDSLYIKFKTLKTVVTVIKVSPWLPNSQS